jgi:hypothetical protein
MNKINLTKINPDYIYIGIGSANNDLHQFPPFFRNLYMNHINKCCDNCVKTFLIILIDPIIENVPTIIKKNFFEKMNNFNQIGGKWNIDNKNTNIIIFSIKEYFEYSYDIDNNKWHNYGDIKLLEEMNKWVIINKKLMIVHSFTGNSLINLEKYFYDMFKDFTKYILYDIANHYDETCLPDLNDINMQPIVYFSYDTTNTTSFREYNSHQQNMDKQICISEKLDYSHYSREYNCPVIHFWNPIVMNIDEKSNISISQDPLKEIKWKRIVKLTESPYINFRDNTLFNLRKIRKGYHNNLNDYIVQSYEEIKNIFIIFRYHPKWNYYMSYIKDEIIHFKSGNEYNISSIISKAYNDFKNTDTCDYIIKNTNIN